MASAHMVFITLRVWVAAQAQVLPLSSLAQLLASEGYLTVGVVTKPFQFEGAHRMRFAEEGIDELQRSMSTR